MEEPGGCATAVVYLFIFGVLVSLPPPVWALIGLCFLWYGGTRRED